MNGTVAKIKIQQFIKKMASMVIGVLVSVFILATIPLFLGSKNSVLGIVAIFICKLYKPRFSITSYATLSLRMFCLTILATVALQNICLTIILNLIVIFYIVFFLSDEFTPRRFFIYGFAFIILQAYPMELSALPLRLIALFYMLIILFLYFLCSASWKKKRSSYDHEMEMSKIGLFSSAARLYHLGTPEDSCDYSNPILPLTDDISLKLYNNSLRHGGLLTPKDTIYLQLLLFTEEMNQLINRAITIEKRLKVSDYNYFLELSHLLQEIGSTLSLDNNSKSLKKLEEFTASYSLTLPYFNKDWDLALAKLKKILSSFNGTFTSKRNSPSKLGVKEFTSFLRKQIPGKLSLNNNHFRYSIRYTLVIALCFLLAHFIPSPRSYWLPITANAILYPYSEEENSMIVIQAIGSILGIIFFGFLFQFIPPSARFLFAILAYTIFFSVKNQYIQKIFITGISLVLTYPYTGKVLAVGMRFSFLILALLIVWLSQKLILHTDSHKGMINSIRRLLELDTSVLIELECSLTKGKISPYFDELLLRSYLLTNEIVRRERMQTHYQGSPIKDSFIECNRSFIFEAEQLLLILQNEHDKKNQSDALLLLSKIRSSLKEVGKAFQKEVVSNRTNLPYQNTKTEDTYDSYLQHRLSICLNHTRAMQEAIKKNEALLK